MEKRIDRIEKLLQELRLSEVAFCKKANVSIGNFTYVRKNNTDVSTMNIERILDAFPEVSRNWLMFGEGEMFNRDSDGNVVEVNRGNYNRFRIGNINCENVSNSNNNNVSNEFESETIKSLTEAMLIQQKITITTQQLAMKTQEQCERLIAVIEKLSHKSE